jgi:hypothetical protein
MGHGEALQSLHAVLPGDRSDRGRSASARCCASCRRAGGAPLDRSRSMHRMRPVSGPLSGPLLGRRGHGTARLRNSVHCRYGALTWACWNMRIDRGLFACRSWAFTLK